MFRTPPITKNLIIINILLFIAMSVGERWNLDLTGMLGLHFFLAPSFKVHQLVTYMFMHANLTHIFFNLFMLWMFGRTMEMVWGARRFLLFYMVCGIGAGLMQEGVQLATYYIEGLNQYQMVSAGSENMSMGNYLDMWTTVGASGAVYGILLGFGMTFPNQRILLLIPPIPIKAKYMVIASAVIELLLGMSSQGGNVAHFAHLGGMLFGLLLIRHWRMKDNRSQNGFTSWTEYHPHKETMSEKLKKRWRKDYAESYEQPQKPQDDNTCNAPQEVTQEEIDRILEKIKRSGYESLTKIEKQTLFDAAGKK